MSLPGWISPRMKECFAKMLEELFLYQSNGIVSFSTQGVIIKNNNGQQHIITTQDLNQYPEFINNFPSDDIITFEPQPSVPSSEVFDCSEFLKDFNESTIHEEIVIPSPIISSTEIIELAESINLIPTTENTVEQQTLPTTDDEWKTELEEAVKRIYRRNINEEQKLEFYFEIGELLHNRPPKYRKRLQQLKRSIHRKIGRQKFCERPYHIARKTFEIFGTKEYLSQNIVNLMTSQIRQLSRKEVNEYKRRIQC